MPRDIHPVQCLERTGSRKLAQLQRVVRAEFVLKGRDVESGVGASQMKALIAESNARKLHRNLARHSPLTAETVNNGLRVERLVQPRAQRQPSC